MAEAQSEKPTTEQAAFSSDPVVECESCATPVAKSQLSACATGHLVCPACVQFFIYGLMHAHLRAHRGEGQCTLAAGYLSVRTCEGCLFQRCLDIGVKQLLQDSGVLASFSSLPNTQLVVSAMQTLDEKPPPSEPPVSAAPATAAASSQDKPVAAGSARSRKSPSTTAANSGASKASASSDPLDPSSSGPGMRSAAVAAVKRAVAAAASGGRYSDSDDEMDSNAGSSGAGAGGAAKRARRSKAAKDAAGESGGAEIAVPKRRGRPPKYFRTSESSQGEMANEAEPGAPVDHDAATRRDGGRNEGLHSGFMRRASLADIAALATERRSLEGRDSSPAALLRSTILEEGDQPQGFCLGCFRCKELEERHAYWPANVKFLLCNACRKTHLTKVVVPAFEQLAGKNTKNLSRETQLRFRNDLIADWMAKNKDTSVRRLLDLWLSNDIRGVVLSGVCTTIEPRSLTEFCEHTATHELSEIEAEEGPADAADLRLSLRFVRILDHLYALNLPPISSGPRLTRVKDRLRQVIMSKIDVTVVGTIASIPQLRECLNRHDLPPNECRMRPTDIQFLAEV